MLVDEAAGYPTAFLLIFDVIAGDPASTLLSTRIAWLDCHETASSASPVQGSTASEDFLDLFTKPPR